MGAKPDNQLMWIQLEQSLELYSAFISPYKGGEKGNFQNCGNVSGRRIME